MEVVRGRDWIPEGKKISGGGNITHNAYGSHQCAICASDRDDSSLRGCNDVSPLWVIVNWPGDEMHCHRIGDYNKFDLYRHIEGKIVLEF